LPKNNSSLISSALIYISEGFPTARPYNTNERGAPGFLLIRERVYFPVIPQITAAREILALAKQ